MRYELEPETVSHEAILAIKLHLQSLRIDFERVVKCNRTGGKKNNNVNAENHLAAETLKNKMLDCEEAVALFEKWTQEPVEYNLEDEIKDYDTKRAKLGNL